jgi:hypothetical protein
LYVVADIRTAAKNFAEKVADAKESWGSILRRAGEFCLSVVGDIRTAAKNFAEKGADAKESWAYRLYS